MTKHSFWAGVASIMNIWGNYHTAPVELRDEKTDLQAIASDWEAVGRDMENAFGQVIPKHLRKIK